jgi:hypothetical protein
MVDTAVSGYRSACARLRQIQRRTQFWTQSCLQLYSIFTPSWISDTASRLDTVAIHRGIAFSKVVHSNKRCLSIYALSEGDYNSGSGGLPKIYRFGPRIKVHRRHVIQQSEYTMCLIFNADREWRFAKHEDVKSGEIIDSTKWDMRFSKINIPSSERRKVLTLLDEHNINAFSLFRSEESLMETLRVRKLES